MNTARLAKLRSVIGTAVVALGLAAAIGGASASPAQADDWGWRRREEAREWRRERDWREHDWAREREWRERAWREREWRERHWHEGRYAPRPYYYRPYSYWR